MDKGRWEFLMSPETEQSDAVLTNEELLEHWHWCPEWDYLLIGPGMDEMDACICFPLDAHEGPQGSL